MKVILKKNFSQDKVELKAGAEGWLRGHRFGDGGDYCYCDFGDHKMLHIDKSYLSFPKLEIKNEN
jgi:hypothetical protein